ncbi:acyltransferase family protein [bacterium]|nr:acyltransferase family protein [Akkermansiaceae bacterium]MDB4257883.1 acyltransferase family protein [bacterium]MDB0057156.1 acyltransferase family protein [Akkermansiaceae bacterium]MDB0068328.1 acyltransferase family protein [Akkermansiaceae bacterium]MDB4293862.1 acyltransferase family protein [Akkermansiaceae bacterium]
MITGPRYHFLDGLRGVAMLVGIFFHAAMSFMGYPGWWAVDVRADPASFGVLVDLVHASRMPLFFLVSGFFTAMMWKKRGLGSLVKQRLLRIGVPLLAGTILLTPMMMGLGVWSEAVKRDQAAAELPLGDLSSAVIENDREKVAAILEEGGDPDARDAFGSPLLHLAAIFDHGEMAELLLEGGAELEGRGKDGGTALMTAAFFGSEECVEVLLAAGADPEAKNHAGGTALDSARLEMEVVEAIAVALSIPLDEGTAERRERIAQRLGEMEAGVEAEEEGDVFWYWKGVFTPVFYHLWFLYYLLWLLLIFVPVAWLWRKIEKKFPTSLVKTPWCLLALVPLTFWAQLGMPGSYGPGTATGIFPWGAKLGYYAIFFFLGALAFGRGWWEEKAGTRWWLWFLAALPLFLVTRAWIYTNDHYYAQMGVSLMTWLLLIGLFGFFRRYLNGGHLVVRYLSDASYWLYLGHFPLIVALQIVMQDWEISAWLKFSIMAFGVTGILLVIYEYGVRYTWVGALLNGRKSRATPPLLP